MITLHTAAMTSAITMLLLGALVLGTSVVKGIQPAQAAGFDPPPNQDAPRSTAGGGSRLMDSACRWKNNNSTANNSTANNSTANNSTVSALALAPQAFVGQSKSAHPSLWLYIPKTETATGISTIEISLFDQQLNGIAQTQQPLSISAGLAPIQLSENFTLSPGEAYYWSAAFICNPARRTEDWIVGGWVQYEPLDQQDQQALKNLSTLARVNRYITTGYWYDALTDLLPLLQAPSPSVEIKTAWASLLQQANINAAQINLEEDVPAAPPTDD